MHKVIEINCERCEKPRRVEMMKMINPSRTDIFHVEAQCKVCGSKIEAYIQLRGRGTSGLGEADRAGGGDGQ